MFQNLHISFMCYILRKWLYWLLLPLIGYIISKFANLAGCKNNFCQKISRAFLFLSLAVCSIVLFSLIYTNITAKRYVKNIIRQIEASNEIQVVFTSYGEPTFSEEDGGYIIPENKKIYFSQQDVLRRELVSVLENIHLQRIAFHPKSFNDKLELEVRGANEIKIYRILNPNFLSSNEGIFITDENLFVLTLAVFEKFNDTANREEK